MRDPVGKRFTGSVASVASMILFLLFAACSLIVVSTGSSTYSRISKNYRNMFSSSSAVKYITNKIRSADSAVLSEDGRGIAVYNGDTICVIASDTGGIAEKNIAADTDIDFSGGDMIFDGTSLNISEEGGLYFIRAESEDGVYSAYCCTKEG